MHIKRPIAERENLVNAYVRGGLSKERTAELLGCTKRTVGNYARSYLKFGVDGLRDHRHSNHFRLTDDQKKTIINLKKEDTWRSARNIRDELRLSVHKKTVWQLLRAEGLTKQNLKRVKPIIRFEAEYPNEMWQTDIMGKIDFPRVGTLYLIATLDDHSRFVPAGRWFRAQGKMNVFNVWYESIDGEMWTAREDASG